MKKFMIILISRLYNQTKIIAAIYLSADYEKQMRMTMRIEIDFILLLLFHFSYMVIKHYIHNKRI